MKKAFWILGPFLLAASLRADYFIILPENADQQEKEAAAELSAFLPSAVKEKTAVINEGRPAAGRKIYLGKTDFARRNGMNGTYRPEEWHLRACGDSLIITGGNERGILYGVMEFLDRELGIVFPDETSAYIPDQRGYRWKNDLDRRGKPAFPDRGIYAYFTGNNGPRVRYMLRNRLNMFNDERYDDDMRKWQISSAFGSPKFCHTFHDYTKDLGPEFDHCFSMDRSGKRIRSTSGSGPGQVCCTDPDTKRIFLEKLTAYIEADRARPQGIRPPRIYVLDPNDHPTVCCCPECMKTAKKYGSYSGVVIEFINHLAREIRKKYPDVVLLTSAYMSTSEPPHGIRPESNVIIRPAQLGCEWGSMGIRDTMLPLSHPFNRQAAEMITNWSRLGKLAIWDYWILYDGKSNLPTLNTEAIARSMKFYARHNVVSVFAECESAHIASFHPLRLWLGARFMNDPDLSFDREVGRFMTAYYGPAAGTMKQYHDLLLKTVGQSGHRTGRTPAARRTELDREFFIRANRLLDLAEKTAGNDPKILPRIKRERVSLDFGLLERKDFLDGPEIIPAERLTERFRTNFLAACSPSVVSRQGARDHQRWMENYLLGKKIRVALPDQFKNRNVLKDFSWNKIGAKSRRIRLADDPDAAGGKCFQAIDPKEKGRDIRLGAYDAAGKKHLKNLTLKKQLPDGRYHYYSTGTFRLTPNCFIWCHWSWNIQADLSEFYDRSGLNNLVEAFVSVKTEMKDGKSVFSVDRIILTRQE